MDHPRIHPRWCTSPLSLRLVAQRRHRPSLRSLQYQMMDPRRGCPYPVTPCYEIIICSSIPEIICVRNVRFSHFRAMTHAYMHSHACTGKNTGYKNYDPSHPCSKCWEKYAKRYTGALTYTPWSLSGNDPRMQRPLPKFVPPHLAQGSPSDSAYASPQPPSESSLSPPQHPHHHRSVSQPHQQTGPSYFVLSPLGPYDATPPVPHAIPVSPGDPRLGGRLCIRCGGEGIRTVMLIDVMTCDACGGTGRIWR